MTDEAFLRDLMQCQAVPLAVRQQLQGARCLHAPAAVDFAVDQLAVRLAVALTDAAPLILTMMPRGLALTGMLMRRLVMPAEFGYLQADDATQATMRQVLPSTEVVDRTVLLLDATTDLDGSRAELKTWLGEQGAAQVLSTVLVQPQNATDPADFHALNAPAGTLIGCGMDLGGYARNLPGIYLLAE